MAFVPTGVERGLSLLALPALAASAATELLPLWSEIAPRLEAVGFWDSLTRSDPYAGIVLLPILLALFVPALVSAAALFSIAFPIALLPLLATRSRCFPTLLAMGAVCQIALVLAGWLAADGFARLAEQASAAMAAAEDAEAPVGRRYRRTAGREAPHGPAAARAYVSAEPVPGATLAQPPATVRVSLGAALDPASSLSITRLVLPPDAGEQPKDVEISHHIAPDDPERRTLEGVPSHLPTGLYRVSWRALPAGGGVPRHGSFSFGVGVTVPTDTADRTYSLQDCDAGARGRRHTFAGGALLLALGVLLPRLAPR